MRQQPGTGDACGAKPPAQEQRGADDEGRGRGGGRRQGRQGRRWRGKEVVVTRGGAGAGGAERATAARRTCPAHRRSSTNTSSITSSTTSSITSSITSTTTTTTTTTTATTTTLPLLLPLLLLRLQLPPPHRPLPPPRRPPVFAQPPLVRLLLERRGRLNKSSSERGNKRVEDGCQLS